MGDLHFSIACAVLTSVTAIFGFVFEHHARRCLKAGRGIWRLTTVVASAACSIAVVLAVLHLLDAAARETTIERLQIKIEQLEHPSACELNETSR